MLEAFPINGSKTVCDGVCFSHQAMTESVFSEASGVSYKGSAFRDGVCDGVCF